MTTMLPNALETGARALHPSASGLPIDKPCSGRGTAIKGDFAPSHSIAGLRPIERWVLLIVFGMALARGIVASVALLSPDEATYWLWTRPLQLSYLDHPAMVAYWIWAGTRLLGDSALGVRIVGVASGVAVSFLVWDTARIAFASRAAGARAALWLNSTILFSAVGTIMTPDAPLLLCWTTVLWTVVRLVASGSPTYLYAAAFGLGLAAISKYTAALLLPALLVTGLSFRSLRRWLRSGHFWVAAALGALCTTPLFWWNLYHGFASFHKQLEHAESPIGDPLRNVIGYVGGQIGLATPLIFGFGLWGMGWALWAGWRQRRPAWVLLGFSSLPILAFFTAHALTDRVQAQWSGPAYIGGVIALAGAVERIKFRSPIAWAFRLAPVVGLTMTAVVLFQATTALLPIPVKFDPLKRLGGWDELAGAIEQERLAYPGAFLLAQGHLLPGPISYYLPDHAPVFLEGPMRPNYYTAAAVAALKGRDAIFITRAVGDRGHALDAAAELIAPFFARVRFLRRVLPRWGGRPADVYALYLGEHYRGGLLVIGDGYPGTCDARLPDVAWFCRR
jgi:4-amino-4-deoxy-L-arabinose transferase-like glycosyltransferase